MRRPLLILAALSLTLNAQEPIRQPTEARFWLKVPAAQSPLRDVQTSAGNAVPAPWEKDQSVRERHLDVVFPIRWWDWREMSISFTPVEDGTVDLVLCGPWEEEKPGTVFRKEVLWDEISATGATLSNGGFEDQKDGNPENWKALYGNPLVAGGWPVSGVTASKGKFIAASWQNRPLAQAITVKAGHPVKLTFHAKAATVPGFVEPRRLGQNTAAHSAVQKIKKGVNLGNCWDAPPPYTWGIRYTPEDIDRIADEGFDHIRVPVAWAYNLVEGAKGPEINPTLLADLEPVLRRALDRNMHVLLDWHHYNDFTDDPEGKRARFKQVWETIARHFKSWSPALFLELLNEPRDLLTTEVANPIYAETIEAIRKIDPERIIFVSPGKWGDPRELDKLRLPDNDEKLVVTVHCYEPFFFTHQGAGWVQLQELKGLVYPGPPATPLAIPASLKGNMGLVSFVEAYNSLPTDRNPCSSNAVKEMLDLSREWSVHFGRPIHLGEFGSHDTGDQESRARYARDVRVLAEARGIPWTLWDWKATFGYWDSKSSKPLFKAALFD